MTDSLLCLYIFPENNSNTPTSRSIIGPQNCPVYNKQRQQPQYEGSQEFLHTICALHNTGT